MTANRHIRTALALATASVAWPALALQLWVMVDRSAADGAGLGEALWQFFGYFTILVNCAVAIVATAMATGSGRALAGPRTRMATASAIAIVGIVYSLALRSLWQPEGWQAVADHALHDVTPVLFLLAWLASCDGSLNWRDVRWAIVGPCLYSIYALVRGRLEDWRPYWFMDPQALGIAQTAVSLAVLTAGLVAIAMTLIALDRYSTGRLSAAGRTSP